MKQVRSQSFSHGALIIMLGTFVSKFIGIFFRLVIGWQIGAEGCGYYGTAYSVYKPLYAISLSGLPVALAKIIAENSQSMATHIFKVSRKVFIGLGLVLTLLMALGSGQLADNMHNSGARFAIIALAPVAFFGCVSSAYKGYYEGLRDMYPTAKSEVIEALTKLVCGPFFAVWGMRLGAEQFAKTKTLFGLVVANQREAELICGAAGAICGIAGGCFLGMIFLITSCKIRKLDLHESTPKSSKEIISTLVGLAIPICLSSVVFNISGQIDAKTAKIGLEQAVAVAPLFFKNLVGRIPVNNIPNLLWGGFGLTFPIYNFVPSIVVSFGVCLLPNLAAAWVAKDRNGIQKFLESGLRITNLLGFSAGLFVFSSAKSILFLVYSKRAAEMCLVVSSLRILGLCLIFTAFTASVNITLQAIGRVKLPTILMIMGVVIKYTVNKKLVVIPAINIKGAAIGSLTCYVFIAITGFLMIMRLTQIKINVKSVFLKPALVGLSTMCVGFFFEQFCLPGAIARNVFAVCVPLFFCGIFVFVFGGFEEEDLLMLPHSEKLVAVLRKCKLLH
ncbi:MAG: oligosaccharide flippase family protein [Oscillospiraceae bacterium]|jgi:stage V sporulation protein B|nr:oligosaccharide flippase family protein [Oscillospiraceae bacterium]